MISNKLLTCEAISPEEFECKLGENSWKVRMENALFDIGSLNNLKRVSFKGKAKFRLYASKIELETTDNAEILCNYDNKEEKLYCKAVGPYDSYYTEDYDSLLVIPSFREPTTPEEQEVLNNTYQEALSEFPPLQEKMGWMRVFISPELDKNNIYAVTFFSFVENELRPVTIFVSNKSVSRAIESEDGRKLLLTDLIHELTHVYRGVSGEAKPDLAEDEAETYAEELVPGTLPIREELDVPTGVAEEGMLAPRCVLPYCFKDLEEVHEFEKLNYEIMTGYEEWKPIYPGTPEWEEVRKRAPFTPIADVVRVYYKGYHPDSDVNEYWVVVRSPSGKKYAYHLTDLRVDDESLDFVEVIETVDKLNLTKGEDIEVIEDIA